MGKIIGMPKNKKEESYRRGLWNFLSVIFFFAMSYFTLNYYFGLGFWVLGILFLIAGLYGSVSLYNKKKFVF